MRVLPIVMSAYVAACIVVGAPAMAASDKVGQTEDPAHSLDAVAETMREMYAALSVDDAVRLKAIIADDFYAFDGGKRSPGKPSTAWPRPLPARPFGPAMRTMSRRVASGTPTSRSTPA